MTDIIKILEALRKPVTGNGPELDTIDAWNNALEAANKALEQNGIYGPFTTITVSGRSEPLEPVQTLAEAYRAGLKAAAEACEQVAYGGQFPQDDQVELGCLRSRDYILALPVPTEFDRTTVFEFGGK